MKIHEVVITHNRDEQKRAHDLVKRNFRADQPNLLWVADFTYIQTNSGWVYAAVNHTIYNL